METQESITPEAKRARDIFRLMTGVWRFEFKTSEKATRLLTSTGKRVNTLIFDGLKLEYKESFDHQPMKVRGTIGYDDNLKRYYMVSFANLLPSFEIMPGELHSNKLLFHNAHLAEDTPGQKQQVVLDFISKNEYHYTSFTPDDAGEWHPVYRITYQREPR